VYVRYRIACPVRRSERAEGRVTLDKGERTCAALPVPADSLCSASADVRLSRCAVRDPSRRPSAQARRMLPP
jgi:hypothetical protein